MMETEFRALVAATVAHILPLSHIAWGVLPDNTAPPAISLHQIDNADGLTQQGPDGLWRGRVQVDCLALEYAEAAAMKDALIAGLNGYRGGGFRLIRLDRYRDDQDKGAVDRPFLISLDFLTSWRAS
ncbi:hypothetical protein [Thioclava sp. GXIMD4215]|uniref:tail completion protein gp17 n=1 Tax=Thioclava sp. GXIMD4215 TaxID=3131928 RepID=UPI00324A9B09